MDEDPIHWIPPKTYERRYPETLVVCQFHDTFEWAFWHSGHALFSTVASAHLTSLTSLESPLVSLDSGLAGRTWAQLPEGDFKKALGQHCKLRALQSLFTLEHTRQPIELLDEDGKIVVRTFLHQWFMSPPAGERQRLGQALVTESLLGYQGEYEALCSHLAYLSPATVQSIPHKAIDLLGISPRVYQPKPTCSLSPEMKCIDAVARLAENMLEVIKINQPGIVEDIDTEFLHDYRVSMRRLRSLLSQVKEIYPMDAVGPIKEILGSLARATNELRDLDVYLLSQDDYLSLIPPSLRAVLDEMFRDIKNRRKVALHQVRAHLTSSEYTLNLEKVEVFFSSEHTLPEQKRSRWTLHKMARREIFKRYQKICRVGEGLVPSTPDENIHKLRIDCKKLRYLLEFFASLLCEDELKALLIRLKELQDNLGRFNDLSVQQRWLLHYLSQKRRPLHRELPVAIGSLIGILYQQQCEERTKVFLSITRFIDTSVKMRFNNLCT